MKLQHVGPFLQRLRRRGEEVTQLDVSNYIDLRSISSNSFEIDFMTYCQSVRMCER